MLRPGQVVLAAAFVAACSPKPAPVSEDNTGGRLSVSGTGFELVTDDGTVLKSADLVGAILEMNLEGGAFAKVRIDAVQPAAERPGILLHRMTVVGEPGGERPLCGADVYGRSAAFPVRGRFDAQGRFIADKDAWLLTCTLGSQAKCLLWGYDPWARGPGGQSLAPYYEACQRLARADYAGDGKPHTKDGTEIDVWDAAGVQLPTRDPRFAFEAGWAPGGATCVARTRWPDLLTLAALRRARPDLAGACDEARARAKGAILFTAVRRR